MTRTSRRAGRCKAVNVTGLNKTVHIQAKNTQSVMWHILISNVRHTSFVYKGTRTQSKSRFSGGVLGRHAGNSLTLKQNQCQPAHSRIRGPADVAVAVAATAVASSAAEMETAPPVRIAGMGGWTTRSSTG